MGWKIIWPGLFGAIFSIANAVAAEDLPPELQDIDGASKRNGFAELFDSYNPRGFSLYSAAVGARLGSGFEYFSSGTLYYGYPGNGAASDVTTKQNLYFGPDSETPVDLSAQAVFASGVYPIYRVGVRWRVSSTNGIRDAFEKIGLAYAVNLQPLQIDSIPGYNWQVEHTYQLQIPDLGFLRGMTLRGVLDQDGGRSGYTMNYSDLLAQPVLGPLSAVVVYKHSSNLPARNYNGLSFGIEYRLHF